MSGYPEHDRMCNAAFEAAAKLTDSIKPSSNDGLESLLRSYSKKIFASKFGFEYGGTPPDSLSARNIPAVATSSSTLGYILGFRIGDDLTWALQDLYSGLMVPPPYSHALQSYMAEHCERVIDTNTLRSWDVHWLDKMYDLDNPTLSPLRQIGVTLGWYDTKRADANGTPLSIAYTFIMTMVYEVESPNLVATRGLLELLYYKLQSYAIRAPSGGDFSMPAMEYLLQIYAAEEFQRAFGFEFRQDATPPDSRKGRIVTFRAMLSLSSLPATVEEVDRWVENEVTSRNDNIFPAYAGGSVFNEIRDAVLRCVGSGYSATTWYQTPVRSFFFNPENPSRGIQHFACYVFIHGETTVKVGEKEVRVQRCLVYYLGLFASYSSDAKAKGVQFDPKKVGSTH